MASSKVSDNDIVALNSVGLSLKSIAQRLQCHHTTVTARLKALGINPADTRRSFMEDIYSELTEPQRAWLVERLGPAHSVKDFVKSLIVNQYLNRNQ